MNHNKKDHYFLADGGEMGKLSRTKDWSRTYLGDPEQWPKSLCTMTAVVLNNPLAMCIAWGNDFTQIYNDAFRLILASPQQNEALGSSAKETFSEIWKIIEPKFTDAMKGKSGSLDDFIISVDRNGDEEKSCYNFLYSPIKLENGEIGGVLITAVENKKLLDTTIKRTVKEKDSAKKIEESNKRFRDTLKQAPVGISILRGPDYFVEMANEAYLQIVDREESSFVGRPLFESLPEVKESVNSLLESVLTTGIPFHGNELPIPLKRFGKIDISYFDFLYYPLKEEDGEISGIIVTVTEVSDKVEARKKTEQNEERLNIVLEASELGTWELNVKIGELIYSPRYLEIVGGYTENTDLTHEQLVQHIHPDDMPIRNKALQDALVSGVLNYETRTIWSDKSIHWVEGKGKVFYDENNKPEKLIGTARDITREKTHQQQIEENAIRFRNLVMQSPVPKAILRGTDMKIEMANFVLLKNIWKKNESDVQGKRILDVFPELQEQKYAKLLQEVYSNGNVIAESESLLIIESNSFYVDFEFAPLLENDNSISGIKITLIDVTEKVETRKKIEESEKRFRSLTESIPQLIWETDEKGNYLFASGKWVKYSGIHPEGKESWNIIIHPDDLKGNTAIWKHSLKTGEAYRSDVRILRKDGAYRWHTAIGEPVLDENNKIVKWVGAFSDIHTEKAFSQELEQQVAARTRELLLMNESLKKSEERYHLMVEEVQDYAILYLNQDGIIENWNIGAEKIKGYKSEEIIGKNFQVFYTEEDKKNKLPQTLLQLAREKGKAVQEGWRVKKNGKLFWSSVVITAVHNKKNEIIGFSKVTHDLTEKKKADDKLKLNALELKQKNIELELMNQELQSFAYISSHDLQEPLRKIQTFATQIMEKESINLSETGKDKFKRMQNAAQRMQTLINDLLAYSRTNVEERIFKKTDLSKIINEVKEDLKEELTQKDAVIEIGESCELKIIPFQFRQLLYNLVSNSLKFSKPDIPAVVKIKSEVKKGEDLGNNTLNKELNYCHISVADNGIGFEEQYSKKIFEVFQRLHGRDQYKGTGIGLAIVKKIVDNHNGVITASGEQNEGAVFDIYIPIN
ncbi:PAS domain-containing sensor histidine kinase [Flavobacterium reichenbachii]|uniref:histidine kinase n=1 Tax=Flavobacterium reichenbachii TaxID=362418 RepID=A0A085ZID6_9FLAO|nr:PAS domain S-box protein [Flavobacterium reichenbachii]KFF04200.1 histidine kinase [Flavobacterium reichenbachii]OXB13900.1 PAS domain-containing sensor histidine kinase [Flavobacterium reichenbachii]